MKIRKAIGYNIEEQREIEVNFLLDRTQIKEIINKFFDEMEYKDRKSWILNNVPEPNAALIDSSKKEDQPPFAY
tara:strand:+ start:1065 stop:1286 length:222 start_codon:yes stop_codon:yes gene_type:complete